MRLYAVWIKIYCVYVQKHIAHRAVCFNFPLVRDKPLGAPAFVKLVYLHTACFVFEPHIRLLEWRYRDGLFATWRTSKSGVKLTPLLMPFEQYLFGTSLTHCVFTRVLNADKCKVSPLWHGDVNLNTHNRYPIARPWGWYVGYLSWIQNLTWSQYY